MKKFKKAKDIKVGVIGYGGAFNMGRIHLEQMQAAGMTPIAVTELDKERLKIAKEEFPGIETYSSVSEMLKKSDVNFITIITPHNTHAKLALQCLKSGRSVCCEKPLAITTAECDKMIAEAEKQDVVLTTYHNRHWDGSVMQALEIIKKGSLGDIARIQLHSGNWAKPRDWWRASRSISGGILYDWGVHFLEYMFQIMGDAKMTEVSGFSTTGFWADETKWKDDCIEDDAFVTIRFDSGKMATLNISCIESNPKPGFMEITGTKGTLVLGHTDYELITHKDEKILVEKGKNMPSDWPKYYQNIADYMTKGKELVITAEWSRRPIHVLDLAVKSAAQGKAIKTKYN